MYKTTSDWLTCLQTVDSAAHPECITHGSASSLVFVGSNQLPWLKAKLLVELSEPPCLIVCVCCVKACQYSSAAVINSPDYWRCHITRLPRRKWVEHVVNCRFDHQPLHYCESLGLFCHKSFFFFGFFLGFEKLLKMTIVLWKSLQASPAESTAQGATVEKRTCWGLNMTSTWDFHTVVWCLSGSRSNFTTSVIHLLLFHRQIYRAWLLTAVFSWQLKWSTHSR